MKQTPSQPRRRPKAGLPLLILAALSLASRSTLANDQLPWIAIDSANSSFIEHETGKPFFPTGFNYDHDRNGQLLEDYWLTDWPTIAEDFAEMKQLGANTVRIHLQFGKFMDSPTRPNSDALKQLEKLLALAQDTGLYLNLTGLGCYHKQDVPAWYDQLSETERWKAQSAFWIAIASTCKNHSAVFCYDLMNEPVAPGGDQPGTDWLGPAFAGKHFVQRISLDRKQRPRTQIAKAWIEHLVQAIHSVDKRHLITVGLVPWSLDRPGLTSGFVPKETCQSLDFISVHLYPESGKIAEAQNTLQGFAETEKPLVLEETFPLKCSSTELIAFLDDNSQLIDGVTSFYWGKKPDEDKKPQSIGEAITADWLRKFAQWQTGRQNEVGQPTDAKK